MAIICLGCERNLGKYDVESNGRLCPSCQGIVCNECAEHTACPECTAGLVRLPTV